MRKRVLATWRPASIFALLSLAFGSIIIFANPPLRGPDEIAHFLRIYSYARGELLPITEINARKGIFVSSELYNELYFFKTAGELFARSREEGVRYGRIMAAYSKLADVHGNETEEASLFAPFAGTEGYNPAAYIPYIVAAEIGRLLRLDFPDMLLLMRLFGLLAFTAVAAYAIAVTPVLKWTFLLIAMLPVSLYNRAVLSADRAALSYTLAITALCFSATRKPAGGQVWERSLWMTLCALGKQPQIVFVLLELMICRPKESRRWGSLAIVVLPGLILSPLWVVAVSADIAVWRLIEERNDSSEQFDPLWKLLYMWDHPYHFPAGSMDGCQRLGGQAVAGTHWHRGLAGYSASALDLSRTHYPPPTRATSKVAAGRSGPCARDGCHWPCCRGVHCPRLSNLFSHLYAHRYRPCPRRPRTLFRDRAPRGCDIHRCRSQPRTATWHARSDCDCRLNDRRNHDCRSGTASALVNEWPRFPGFEPQHFDMRQVGEKQPGGLSTSASVPLRSWRGQNCEV